MPNVALIKMKLKVYLVIQTILKDQINIKAKKDLKQLD